MGSNKNTKTSKPNSSRRCTCHQSKRQISATSNPRSHDSRTPYTCRVCRQTHPLKKCGKFLAMTPSQRQDAVRKHRYCINCLAHQHTTGRCSSETRCKHCNKFHHTLLHVDPCQKKEQRKTASSSQQAVKINPSPRSESAKPVAKEPTLSSLVRPKEIILLPTVCVFLDMPNKERYLARCLLNTGTPYSKVHVTVVEKLRYMRYLLEDETLCPLKLQSVYDNDSFLEHTFRVEAIAIRTPTESLSSSLKKQYQNISLADTSFYVSDHVDIVLGMDVYRKIIIPGDISKPGLPDATNTIFGYSINGSYAS